MQRFPRAIVLADHSEVPALVRHDHRWALVFNDPCGYASHGISTMETLASLLPTDWIITFNEGMLKRLMGMNETAQPTDTSHVLTMRQRRTTYGWMMEPRQWARRLGAQHMARSVFIAASAGFRYRILVLAYLLSQTLRPPTWESIL